MRNVIVNGHMRKVSVSGHEEAVRKGVRNGHREGCKRRQA
jgi:hypothetical protein